jgi:hypothetical protein
MRILSIFIVGAALIFPMHADAQTQPKPKAKPSAQDRGARMDKCMAEATGYGAGKQAQVRACMQRGK